MLTEFCTEFYNMLTISWNISIYFEYVSISEESNQSSWVIKYNSEEHGFNISSRLSVHPLSLNYSIFMYLFNLLNRIFLRFINSSTINSTLPLQSSFGYFLSQRRKCAWREVIIIDLIILHRDRGMIYRRMRANRKLFPIFPFPNSTTSTPLPPLLIILIYIYL